MKPGDTVVLDNLNVHKVIGVREAIKAIGARIFYLPAYSPAFNPIEQAFAILKALLRTVAARTIPDLWQVIRDAFAAFSAQPNAETTSPPQATTLMTLPERTRL